MPYQILVLTLVIFHQLVNEHDSIVKVAVGGDGTATNPYEFLVD